MKRSIYLYLDSVAGVMECRMNDQTPKPLAIHKTNQLHQQRKRQAVFYLGEVLTV
ncbi:hypothetical protein BH11PLA2_BH11PLA2_30940 [soil metagenome]